MVETPKAKRRAVTLKRRLLFALIAVSGSSVALGVLTEIALWVFAPIPFGEFIEWIPEGHIRAIGKPNQVVRNITDHKVTINRHGFRGPDYSFEKAPGTLRIAVFGGSAGFCFRAPGDENTWPALVEAKLSKALALPVEVINLSLPGYNVFNSKINYLCFGRAFNPDAVLVYHTWNDMKEFRSLETLPYRSVGVTKSASFWKRLARKTQLGRRAYELKWKLIRRDAESSSREAETSGRDDDPVSEEALAWERKNFEDFVLLSRDDGRLPILVSQAGLVSKNTIQDMETRLMLISIPERTSMTIPEGLETWLKVSSIIEDVARSKGAVFIDGYSSVPHDLDHFHDHVHLIGPGLRKLADGIAKALLADQTFMKVVGEVRAEAG